MIEEPGAFPYTRGISAEPQPWIMGQYAGFGTPAETNERFRSLLAAGVTGFSVALDLPTQLGLDPDDPRAAGEVGRIGVSIASLADVEVLMRDVPLERIAQVRTTANAIGPIWIAFLIALARKRGVDPGTFGLFVQNDILKEFIARGTQIFPPRPSLRLAADTIEHVARHVPRWVPLAMSGYHIREAGSTAVQEIAFTFANGIAYLDAVVARGVPIDEVAPSLFTFLSVELDVVGELAKLRAARRVWARLVRRRYAPRDPRSEQLRIFVFTAGSSLTAQQPLNNVVRTTIEALTAALAGVQTMHVCAYDEALGVPTEEAALLALRTQQVIQLESGALAAADPFGGAPVLEAATDRIAAAVEELLVEIEDRGGALACIESGWFRTAIAESAYRRTRAVEDGSDPVVGVNRHVSPPSPLTVFRVDPAAEQAQVEGVRRLRAERDGGTVAAALDAVTAAATAGVNVVPATIDAVTAYATVGEICDRLRAVFGTREIDAGF